MALQGAVSEHLEAFTLALERLGLAGEVAPVRTRDQLRGLDGLALPGGESTTIARLLRAGDLAEPIRELAGQGMGLFATCAGAILMAREVEEGPPDGPGSGLGLMDLRVSRNAFGRQRESFEASLKVEGLERPYRAIFIRAPAIVRCWGDCVPLASHGAVVVAARQGRLWALSFHPELSDDTRLHEAFIRSLLPGGSGPPPGPREGLSLQDTGQ